MGMKQYRFNSQQKAEYEQRLNYYLRERWFLKDARAMARQDIENQIFARELEERNKSKGE